MSFASEGSIEDIIDKAEYVQPAASIGPSLPERPVIRVQGGTLDEQATQGEAAIILAGKPVYQRNWELVRPVFMTVEASDKRRTTVAQFVEIENAGIRDLLCQSATFERFNAKSKKMVRIDPPSDTAATIRSRVGNWTFPTVAGLITTPTLRPDGSVLDQPGYDESTRLLLFDPPAMPLMPDNPSKQDALDALALLLDLLDEFPFADDESRAVALSALMTPVVRGAFQVAPMHVVRAPAAGSGKSFLLDVAATILSGQVCPVIALGRTEEETEKRIGAALLAGQPLVSIDNVNGELGGDALCQAIERPLVAIRVLGKSELVMIESRASFFATGNNLRLIGDVTRRAITCTLDARVEHPECRKFARDPIAMVLADRGAYVAACLTIARAYRLADQPVDLAPFGSFSGWSDTVRSALVWLGCADPILSTLKAKDEDPKRQALGALIGAWSLEVGCGSDTRRTASEVIALAVKGRGGLFDAVKEVAWNRANELDAKMLGKYLSDIADRIVNGLAIRKKVDNNGHPADWWLDRCGSSGSSG